MNFKSSTFIILAAFIAGAIPLQPAAQDKADHHKHHHYKLIDLGTSEVPAASFPASRL